MKKEQELEVLEILHEMEKYIINTLNCKNVIRGFQKIYDESGSTGKGFMYFSCELPDGQFIHYYVIDPEYLVQMMKEGYNISFLEDKEGLYINSEGKIRNLVVKLIK